jgi:hypothetical protein
MANLAALTRAKIGPVPIWLIAVGAGGGIILLRRQSDPGDVSTDGGPGSGYDSSDPSGDYLSDNGTYFPSGGIGDQSGLYDNLNPDPNGQFLVQPYPENGGIIIGPDGTIVTIPPKTTPSGGIPPKPAGKAGGLWFWDPRRKKWTWRKNPPKNQRGCPKGYRWNSRTQRCERSIVRRAR